MKKIISRALAVVLASCLAVGCASASSSTTTADSSSTAQSETLSVVTTIFPIYDWTKEILGEDLENVTLTYLEDTGVDVHSFEPTVDDMVTMTNCDMFIYVGGESDTWVAAVLANAENPDMVVINLTEVLGDAVMEEAEVEGMQEHDHDHDDEEVEDDHDHDDEEVEDDHDHDDEEVEDDHDHDDEEAELDEHVWLSLNNAAVVCQVIADELAALNPAQADLYAANAANYLSQLSELDAQYQAVVAQANQTTLLFADRFPFLYLMEDYGLSYYAAFAGCSSETEATFETIAFLAGKLDELELTVVLTTEDPAPSVAETVIASSVSADQIILALDSMQAVTAAEVASGASYLSIMESNLEVIAQAVQ
ncbi:MAG: metal ABC transporter substrate-binding protein [Faecalibacterium sp.]